MAEENKSVELSEEKTEYNTTIGAIKKDERDEACESFVCIKCGGTHNQHKIEGTNVFTNVKGYWCLEWNHYMLDCNHCKYFRHISWATGECTKDCQ